MNVGSHKNKKKRTHVYDLWPFIFVETAHSPPPRAYYWERGFFMGEQSREGGREGGRVGKEGREGSHGDA